MPIHRLNSLPGDELDQVLLFNHYSFADLVKAQFSSPTSLIQKASGQTRLFCCLFNRQEGAFCHFIFLLEKSLFR